MRFPYSIPSPQIDEIPINFTVPGINIHVDFSVKFYAIIILIGVVVAIILTGYRWKKRGAPSGAIIDIALWTIPFGLVGARLYHVVTSPDRYFGEQGNLGNIIMIREGGLGIWGAVLLGALGAWIGCRIKKLKFSSLADSVAPALLLAQGIGRWGNYFNQELYGQPTNLPWGLEIDNPEGYPAGTTFHPTFLYESLWCIFGAILLILLDKKFRFTRGRLFLLYIMFYCLGRFWIEMLRVDDAQMPEILGMKARLNVWVSIVCFIVALVWFVVLTVKYKNEKYDMSTAWLREEDAVVYSEQNNVTKNDKKLKNDNSVQYINSGEGSENLSRHKTKVKKPEKLPSTSSETKDDLVENIHITPVTSEIKISPPTEPLYYQSHDKDESNVYDEMYEDDVAHSAEISKLKRSSLTPEHVTADTDGRSPSRHKGQNKHETKKSTASDINSEAAEDNISKKRGPVSKRWRRKERGASAVPDTDSVYAYSDDQVGQTQEELLAEEIDISVINIGGDNDDFPSSSQRSNSSRGLMKKENSEKEEESEENNNKAVKSSGSTTKPSDIDNKKTGSDVSSSKTQSTPKRGSPKKISSKPEVVEYDVESGVVEIITEDSSAIEGISPDNQ